MKPNRYLKNKMENSRKPTISACMIVKNEEELLPDCLNSIKNAVDEIIIVDTGSTDNTVNVAQRFGAKVYHHPWKDSFSEARNHSLRYATGDWILQIDADEELEQADISSLHHAIHDNRYNGIIVSIQSVIKNSLHKFFNTRIFRRGKGYYKDIIHEQIVVEGERLPSDIRLYHHGYNLDEAKMQKKWQRTTQLLKKQIAQNKSNGFAWFNLVRNYRTQELFDEGIAAGEEALKIVTPDVFSKHGETNVSLHHYVMIIYETANCYLHKENFVKAKELCCAAISTLARLKIAPENIDITYTLASTFLKEENYPEAIDYFKRFLALREWHFRNMNAAFLMVDTLGYDYAAHNGLGYCYGTLGQWQTAIGHLQKAVAANPKYLTAYKNLALCYSGIENHAGAINTLLQAVSEGITDDGVTLKLGELYIKQGSYEKALSYLETYLKKRPEDKPALLKIAQCYEQLGCLEAAVVGYRAALEAGKSSPE